MADFDIHDPNVFSEKLRKFETKDKAHADLFNAVVEVLINNDAFLKAVADDYSKRHKTDETIHISAKEREEWNEKADKNTATQTENGLFSADDKKKLDGIATGANKYTHPTTDGNKHVPATGNTNDGKLLIAGSTSGVFGWKHPTFTQAASRANLTSGEKLMISLGKIMKWFADLKAHAFAYPVNNLLGTDTNLALSAPMGKELDRKITELNGKITNKYKNNLGGAVDLAGIGSNTYTFPADGYLYLRANYTRGCYVKANVLGKNGANYFTVAVGSLEPNSGWNNVTNNTESVYVRAGMLVKDVQIGGSNNRIAFIPLQ